jgi:hypothetical protein
LLEFLSGTDNTHSTDHSTDHSSSSSSRLGQVVAAQGPVLPGPQGALVAVLAQQQVLAPVSGVSTQPAAATAGLHVQLRLAKQDLDGRLA